MFGLFRTKTVDKKEVIAVRNAHFPPQLALHYPEDPLLIVRGKGCYMQDEKGNSYLDCCNNVIHVGHAHPAVVAAVRKQVGLINVNNRYLNPLMGQYAKELTATLPHKLSCVYLVNSGSEANDLAMRLARAYTKNEEIIYLEGSYHGITQACTDISWLKTHPYHLKVPPTVHAVPIPDTFRGKYRSDDPQAGTKYADYVRSTIATLLSEDRKMCAFIAESLQSCGGQIVYPPTYLQKDDTFHWN